MKGGASTLLLSLSPPPPPWVCGSGCSRLSACSALCWRRLSRPARSAWLRPTGWPRPPGWQGAPRGGTLGGGALLLPETPENKLTDMKGSEHSKPLPNIQWPRTLASPRGQRADGGGRYWPVHLAISPPPHLSPRCRLGAVR